MPSPSARRQRTPAPSPPAQQLTLALGADGGGQRWRYSRLVVASASFPRIQERLELVRRHFPELDGVCIRVGLARRRGVLGWGSLDPDAPGIWVRPRRLELFTIAHELTHLLQARGALPAGERACDLHALARSPLLVDAAPGYLEVPPALREARRLPAATGRALHEMARQALRARAEGRRDYLRLFERIAATLVAPTPTGE